MAETERPLEELDNEYLFKKATEEAEAPPQEVVEPELPLEPTPPPPQVPEPPPAVEAQIPTWRLREEAEARRIAEDRARLLEARLNEVAAHIQQQQKPQDFFENPDAATQAMILRTLQPFAEEQRRTQMYNSKVIATVAHGADKVEEAEQAFLRARADEVLDPADYERVVQAPNRYDAVVRWHRQQSTLSAVGEDPEAWYQKRREADMNDPKFQAEVIKRAQQGAASRPSMTRMPPSLSKSTAARSNASPVGDGSDASLWDYATKR